MHSPFSAARRLAQPLRQGFKGGGLIRGPGSGTSDSIPAEVPEGTFILPADSTQSLGLAAQALGGNVPINVSNGEFEVSPEQVQQIGASVLDILRGVTHAPAEHGDEPPPQNFADGGQVSDVTRVGNSYSGTNVGGSITVNGQAPAGTVSENPSGRLAAAPAAAPVPASPPVLAGPTPSVPTMTPPAASASAATTAPAAPAPMGWAERNAQRNAQVTASSIVPSRERDAAQASLAAAAAPAPAGLATTRAQPATPSYGLVPAATATSASARLGLQPAPVRTNFADGGIVEDERRRAASYNGAAVALAGANPNTVPVAPAVGTPASSGPLGRAAAVSPAPVVLPPVDAAGGARQMLLAPPPTIAAPAPDMGTQAPTVRHSGNDWAARKQLANLETAASSITNRRRWGGQGDRSDDSQAFQRAVGNDLALQGAENNMNQAVMDQRGLNARARLADVGSTQRAQLQEQAAGARALLADSGADRRQAVQETGDSERAGMAVQGQTLAAVIKARQAAAVEAAKLGKEGLQQAKDTQDIFTIIDEARPLMKDATGSYGGQALDKLAQAFGSTTDGAKATSQLQVLQGALISKMPKMSGPQSDKDVELYRQMAGQIGDPTVPTARRTAAMDTIERLNMKYLPTAADTAAYEAVPQGSYYRTPTGEIRRKN